MNNHRHHHGCNQCSAARQERDALLKVGICWGSSQALQLHRKQLQRMGMSLKVIYRALRTIHPSLMTNLKLDAGDRIVPIDRRLYWERRLGWGKKAEVLRRKRERQEMQDRAYQSMLWKVAANKRKMRRLKR